MPNRHTYTNSQRHATIVYKVCICEIWKLGDFLVRYVLVFSNEWLIKMYNLGTNFYFLGMRTENNTFVYSEVFHVKFSKYPTDTKYCSAAWYLHFVKYYNS